jgi:hypothetical protein
VSRAGGHPPLPRAAESHLAHSQGGLKETRSVILAPVKDRGKTRRCSPAKEGFVPSPRSDLYSRSCGRPAHRQGAMHDELGFQGGPQVAKSRRYKIERMSFRPVRSSCGLS